QRNRLAEDPAVAGQRRGSLLHPRPARFDEPHYRDSCARRGLQDPDDRVGVTLAERAAQITSVLGVAGDRPAVHAAACLEHPVAGDSPGAQTRRDDPRAQRLHAARIAQRLEAFERIEPPNRLTNQGRAHDAAPWNTSATLAPPNANEFDSATGGRPLDITSGRASPGT